MPVRKLKNKYQPEIRRSFVQVVQRVHVILDMNLLRPRPLEWPSLSFKQLLHILQTPEI